MRRHHVAHRVYPDSRRGFYFEVRVFDTYGAMHAYCRGLGRAPGRLCRAMHMTHEGPGKRIGEIVFARRFVARRGVSVISHECGHAAFRFAERARFLTAIQGDQPGRTSKAGHLMLSSTSPEERYCYALGDLCRQVVEHCYDVGVFA